MKATDRPKRVRASTTTMLPDGQVVVFCEDTNLTCTLSPLGAIVWEFCDGEHAIDEIVSEVQSIEGIAVQASAEEISQLLEDLSDSGLLE